MASAIVVLRVQLRFVDCINKRKKKKLTFSQSLVYMILSCIFQGVEESPIDGVGLSEDNAHQLLGCLDRTISQRENRLQLFQRQRVSSVHLGGRSACVQLTGQVLVMPANDLDG